MRRKPMALLNLVYRDQLGASNYRDFRATAALSVSAVGCLSVFGTIQAVRAGSGS